MRASGGWWRCWPKSAVSFEMTRRRIRFCSRVTTTTATTRKRCLPRSEVVVVRFTTTLCHARVHNIYVFRVFLCAEYVCVCLYKIIFHGATSETTKDDIARTQREEGALSAIQYFRVSIFTQYTHIANPHTHTHTILVHPACVCVCKHKIF